MEQKIVIDDAIASVIKNQTPEQIVSSKEQAAKFLEIASTATSHSVQTISAATKQTDTKEPSPQSSFQQSQVNSSTPKKNKNLTGSQKRKRRKQKQLLEQSQEDVKATTPVIVQTTVKTEDEKPKEIKSPTENSNKGKTNNKPKSTVKTSSVSLPTTIIDKKEKNSPNKKEIVPPSTSKKTETKQKKSKEKKKNNTKNIGRKVGSFLGCIVSFFIKSFEVILSVIESRILMGAILILFGIYFIWTMF